MSDAAGFKYKKKKDPRQDIVELNRVIADKSFKPVHLLYGEEDYLRYQFRDELCAALGAVKGSLSFDRMIGAAATPEKIIDMAETLPFMAEKRVILIEDSGFFKSACPKLEDYINDGVCETTCLIFCEKDVDKRLRLYKAVDKCGMISEFMRQDERTLASWVAGRLKGLGIAIAGNDAAYMVRVVGNDMEVLANETDKLASYCEDRGRATSEDINAICTRALEDKVFEMCEQIALGNGKRAMGLYYDLLGLRESPVKIMVLMTRHFEMLLRIKDMEKRGYGDKQIGSAIGKWDSVVAKYREQTRRYTAAQLKDIVEMCADADMSFKTGMMAEQIALETLMVKISFTSQEESAKCS